MNVIIGKLLTPVPRGRAAGHWSRRVLGLSGVIASPLALLIDCTVLALFDTCAVLYTKGQQPLLNGETVEVLCSPGLCIFNIALGLFRIAFPHQKIRLQHERQFSRKALKFLNPAGMRLKERVQRLGIVLPCALLTIADLAIGIVAFGGVMFSLDRSARLREIAFSHLSAPSGVLIFTIYACFQLLFPQITLSSKNL